ncbi:MAG: hypothetical protein OEY70_12315, partial [Acidimicrobiia bacterium]|nr:hypothetical protein [Acidimicrobiia bacterium]
TTAARTTLTLIPSAPAASAPTPDPTSVVVQLTPDPGDPLPADPATTGSSRRRAGSAITMTSGPSQNQADSGSFAARATLSTALVPPGAPLSAADPATRSPLPNEAARRASTTAAADPAGPEVAARHGDPLTLDLPAGCDDLKGVVATPSDTADGGPPVPLTLLASPDPAAFVVDTTGLAVGSHLLRLDCGHGSPAETAVGIFRQNGAARGEGNSIVLAGGVGLASMAALVGLPLPGGRRPTARADSEEG